MLDWLIWYINRTYIAINIIVSGVLVIIAFSVWLERDFTYAIFPLTLALIATIYATYKQSTTYIDAPHLQLLEILTSHTTKTGCHYITTAKIILANTEPSSIYNLTLTSYSDNGNHQTLATIINNTQTIKTTVGFWDTYTAYAIPNETRTPHGKITLARQRHTLRSPHEIHQYKTSNFCMFNMLRNDQTILQHNRDHHYFPAIKYSRI